jgi:hypothetical protein
MMREMAENLLEMAEWTAETSRDDAKVSCAGVLANALRDWLKEEEQGDETDKKAS